MQKDVRITQFAKERMPPRAELAQLIMEQVQRIHEEPPEDCS